MFWSKELYMENKMTLKYLLLRDIQKIVVVSPHQSDYQKCKYYKIKCYRSLNNLRGFAGKKIYISSDFKKRYCYNFSYLRWYTEIIFFEGSLI